MKTKILANLGAFVACCYFWVTIIRILFQNIMELKKGDRYQFKCGFEVRPYYGEIIEWTGDQWYVVEGTAKGNLETEDSFDYSSPDYTYLGNFAKADDFNELYNLLNS